jgi:hypothetical protein
VLNEPAPRLAVYVDLTTWMEGKLRSATPAWPSTPDVAFAVLFPAPATAPQLTMINCNSVFGSHASVSVGGRDVPFLAVRGCGDRTPIKGADGADFISFTTSHELTEMATDPTFGSAFITITEPFELHVGATNLETSDACEQPGQRPVYREPGFGPALHRSWSNVAARAGHDPCVPADPGPYFGAVPLGLTAVPRTTGLPAGSSRTTSVPAFVVHGETGTLDLGLFSDGPTGAFSVEIEATPREAGEDSVLFALDRNTGVNGEKLHATVHILSHGARSFARCRARSRLGDVVQDWPFVVASE